MGKYVSNVFKIINKMLLANVKYHAKLIIAYIVNKLIIKNVSNAYKILLWMNYKLVKLFVKFRTVKNAMIWIVTYVKFANLIMDWIHQKNVLRFVNHKIA